MKHLFMTSLIAVLLTPMGASAEQITLLDANDFAWETTPEGVAFAALQGIGSLNPIKPWSNCLPELSDPPHVKSANMCGVMLQGEMIHYASGENPETARKIGPGSFYSISSGTAHVSACVSEVPCVAYLYQDGAFDFLPVQQ